MTIDNNDRYIRQINLEEVGAEGQQRLAAASVLIVGVGGLGSPIATLLTSTGIGRLGIVDSDIVSASNLPRQTIYRESDLGKPKVTCAAQQLRAMNSSTEVEEYALLLDAENAESIISQYDIVVDGTDNPESRYLIDDTCRSLGKPYVYGAIRGFEGQVSIFHHNGCGGYSDLYPRTALPANITPPPVMSVTPAIIGAIEANEVFKLILGYGDLLCGKLLTLDLRNYTFNIFELGIRSCFYC